MRMARPDILVINTQNAEEGGALYGQVLAAVGALLDDAHWICGASSAGADETAPDEAGRWIVSHEAMAELLEAHEALLAYLRRHARRPG